jgi:hypothetical protein
MPPSPQPERRPTVTVHHEWSEDRTLLRVRIECGEITILMSMDREIMRGLANGDGVLPPLEIRWPDEITAQLRRAVTARLAESTTRLRLVR